MTPEEEREALLQMVEARPDLDGQFDQLRRIGTVGGTGYFSLVFTANHVVTRRQVAVKFFHPLLRRPEYAYRWDCFQREASILQELQGQKDIIQSISPIGEFSVSLPAGTLTWDIQFAFYGLELAKCDVTEMIESRKWDPIAKLSAFHAMCRGVRRLHSNRISHRDLKPGNFLVMQDGSIKLGDLGAACKLDGKTGHLLQQYAFFPGDRTYSPPEMLACLHDEDPEIAYKSDFFALGGILFELFTEVILGLNAFDARYYQDLDDLRFGVRKGRRRSTFEPLISRIKASHPLPDFEAFGPCVPPGIRQRLTALYKSLADLDFRKRLTDFNSILRQTDICILILKNERTYQRWMEEKRRRRERREQRLQEISKKGRGTPENEY